MGFDAHTSGPIAAEYQMPLAFKMDAMQRNRASVFANHHLPKTETVPGSA